jgi:hypothetical protein
VRDPKKARGLPPDDRSPNARGIQNRSLRQYSNDEPHFGPLAYLLMFVRVCDCDRTVINDPRNPDEQRQLGMHIAEHRIDLKCLIANGLVRFAVR